MAGRPRRLALGIRGLGGAPALDVGAGLRALLLCPGTARLRALFLHARRGVAGHRLAIVALVPRAPPGDLSARGLPPARLPLSHAVREVRPAVLRLRRLVQRHALAGPVRRSVFQQPQRLAHLLVSARAVPDDGRLARLGRPRLSGRADAGGLQPPDAQPHRVLCVPVHAVHPVAGHVLADLCVGPPAEGGPADRGAGHRLPAAVQRPAAAPAGLPPAQPLAHRRHPRDPPVPRPDPVACGPGAGGRIPREALPGHPRPAPAAGVEVEAHPGPASSPWRSSGSNAPPAGPTSG